MYRIENNYKWKTVKHWKTALDTGVVQTKIVENTVRHDIMLEHAVKLLSNNCFPIALVCYQNADKQKEIWLTSLWADIFDFLNGKRYIRKEGQKKCFRELTDDDQQAILNAWIESVWIAGEWVDDDIDVGFGRK